MNNSGNYPAFVKARGQGWRWSWEGGPPPRGGTSRRSPADGRGATWCGQTEADRVIFLVFFWRIYQNVFQWPHTSGTTNRCKSVMFCIFETTITCLYFWNEIFGFFIKLCINNNGSSYSLYNLTLSTQPTQHLNTQPRTQSPLSPYAAPIFSAKNTHWVRRDDTAGIGGDAAIWLSLMHCFYVMLLNTYHCHCNIIPMH